MRYHDEDPERYQLPATGEFSEFGCAVLCVLGVVALIMWIIF